LLTRNVLCLTRRFSKVIPTRTNRNQKGFNAKTPRCRDAKKENPLRLCGSALKFLLNVQEFQCLGTTHCPGLRPENEAPSGQLPRGRLECNGLHLSTKFCRCRRYKRLTIREGLVVLSWATGLQVTPFMWCAAGLPKERCGSSLCIYLRCPSGLTLGQEQGGKRWLNTTTAPFVVGECKNGW